MASKSRLRSLAVGLCALAVASTLAVAAGQFANYPVVGGPAGCSSYSTSGVPGTAPVCNVAIPAGPAAVTGNELIPADTGLAFGQSPQTVTIPSSVLAQQGSGSERNALRGGDFGTNLWQRGTTFTAATPTTAAYVADGWWMYSSGNTATITRQTGASDIVLGSGLRASMRVSRPSGTDITPICVGQIIPASQSGRFLGNNAVFSFYGMAPTTLSSLNDSVDVTIAYGTAADSATPNTNTDAFAKATLTGYTAVTTTNMPLTQTFTRYSVVGAIPTTATTVGVKICYTPLASTGASTDWFEFAGAQLEATVTSNTAPGAFARRNQAAETALEQSYSYGVTELTDHLYPGGVLCTATANAWITIQYAQQMRMTPVLALTAGGFSIQTAVAVTAIGTTTLLTATPQSAKLTSAAACTSTLPYQLKGTNTTGLIMFSAEP